RDRRRAQRQRATRREPAGRLERRDARRGRGDQAQLVVEVLWATEYSSGRESASVSTPDNRPSAGGAPAPRRPGAPTTARTMVQALGRLTAERRILYFGVGDPRRGIVHVIGPEQGLTVPGITLVCGDSHTATHGAFGALAFGIGSSEVEHVLATQTLWQKKPLTMRISVEGRLAPGVSARDVLLGIIAKIGAA